WPENGDGTSTTALSVSTETRGWSATTRSPGLTCQLTISASCRPSPRSGRLKVFIAALPVALAGSGEGQDAPGRRDDARLARQVMLFVAEQRHDRVIAGHALDGRLQR